MSNRNNNNNRAKKQPFVNHISADQAAQQVQAGELFQGNLRIITTSPDNGFVTVKSFQKDVYIPSRQARNRAFDGDEVIVRITNNQEAKAGAQPEGEVVCIAKAAPKRESPGYLQSATVAGFDKFVPLDTRAPHGLLAKSKEAKVGGEELVVVKYGNWLAQDTLPLCTFVRSLGVATSLEAQTNAILMQHQIYQTDEFSQAINEQMEPFSEEWKISPEEIARRRDCRKDRVVSIDPPTARDLDDALSIKLIPEGFEVAVHIADVAFFVPVGSPLDLEAQERCTTVYLTQKAIPMLPRVLSSGLCSLNPGEDRLAMTVIFKMSPEAKVVGEPWFGRTVIQSCCKMSYDFAQNIIEAKSWTGDGDLVSGGHALHDVAGDVLLLHSLAQKLRARRFEDGSLRLNKVKLAVRLDEQNRTCSVEGYKYRESNELIEEYMLLANQMVAEQLQKVYPQLALLRRHPAPDADKSDNILPQLRLCPGFPIIPDGATSKDIQAAITKCEPTLKLLFQVKLARTMQLAKYVCAGDYPDEPHAFRHYALNFELYTHFTSPIRRYADVIVHRLLLASVNNDDSHGLTQDLCSMLADRCNQKKESAKKASEQSLEMALCFYLNWRYPEGYDVDAVLLDLGTAALELLIPDLGIETRIRVGELGCPASIQYDTLYLGPANKPFKRFDSLRVNLSSVLKAPLKLTIRYLDDATSNPSNVVHLHTQDSSSSSVSSSLGSMSLNSSSSSSSSSSAPSSSMSSARSSSSSSSSSHTSSPSSPSVPTLTSPVHTRVSYLGGSQRTFTSAPSPTVPSVASPQPQRRKNGPKKNTTSVKKI